MHERWRHSRWHRAAQYSGALGLFLCLGVVNVKAQQPDFTGVWTNYVAPGQGRGGGAATAGGGRGGGTDLPMTAEGRQKVQAYQALIKGTGDTPGGFCLGTGMRGGNRESNHTRMGKEKFEALIRADLDRWGKLGSELGIKPQ